MAYYLSGSNVQADALQTLHLMNPGYAGYTDASNAGDMVLLNISAGVGQNNSICNDSQQHHYLGFSLPPTHTHNSLSEQSPLPTMCNPSMGQQILSSSLFTNSAGNNAYLSTVNEFSFLPSNSTTQIPQSLVARPHSINSGQQLISQFDMGHQTLDGEHASILHTGVTLGSNTDNSPRHGLSLSLSSRQRPVQMHFYSMEDDESGISSCPGLTHVAPEESGKRVDCVANKWIGNLSHFRANSRDSLLGTGFQDSTNDVSSSRHMPVDSNVPTLIGTVGFPTGSKFLKAAQQLLDEVVSVGHILKSGSSKHVKVPSWTVPSTLTEGSFAKNRSFAEAVTTAKEGIASTLSIPSATSGPEQHLSSTATELTSQEGQDVQMRKAKLMAMLDEVDRRFKQYYSRMQIVMNAFDSVAGFGAAKTYTSLALQTISKHFRCLRDAIDGQIRAESRALGEEDPSSLGVGKGETSNLRYVQQHLRQQRALQHLGMMQQLAWRPQRGLPERSVSVLRAWLFEHFLHPYPKDADKVMLARQTGLSRNQVSNWFINARVRLWKPMVEEMYLEELKESDMDGTASADHASHRENVTSGVTDQGGSENSSQGSKQARAGAGSSEVEGMAGERQQVVSENQGAGSDMSSQQSAARSLKTAGSAHGLDEQQGGKKARNNMEGDYYGADKMMLYADSSRREEVLEDEKKQSLTMRGLGLGGNQTGGSFDASRYGLPAGWSNGVSLTLGLQHCDGLSVAGNPSQQHQTYLHLQQPSYGDGLLPHLAGISDSDSRHHDHDPHHYSYEDALSRKQFPAQMLHWPDFRRS